MAYASAPNLEVLFGVRAGREHLALLWISLAYGGMGRDIAFRLVRR